MAINELLPTGLVPSSLTYQPVRVGSHSKMSTVLQFAINHLAVSCNIPPRLTPSSSLTPSTLQTCPSPLLLHSLPPASPTRTPSTSTPNKTSDSGLTKLVSIAEIAKRARAEALAAAGAGAGDLADAKGKGKGRAVDGVHQYTMVGALEELGGSEGVSGEVDEEVRREGVAVEWLKGGGGGTKRCVPSGSSEAVVQPTMLTGTGCACRPRKKHTPFMIVVLSPVPIPELATWPNFLSVLSHGQRPASKATTAE